MCDPHQAMRWLNLVLRPVAIFWVASWSFVLYLGGRVGTLFVRGREPRQAAVQRLRGRLIRRAMVRLGATFVKLGQIMSTRPDLFDPALIDELRLLQDTLPPFSVTKARTAIECDLGRPVEDLFERFDEQPVAAASVAQVHRAVLKTGEEVAVKVLRPNVREQIHRDGAILRLGARMLAWHPTLRLSDPVGHLDHFVRGIIDQTDLSLEAQNYVRFRENFEGFEGVVFPHIYSELCSDRVLTMAFIRGTKLDALEPGKHAPIARVLSHMWLKMCFVDGFVHADLHPGNLLVTDSGEVAVFDVGLVMKMNEHLLDQFVDFHRCISFGKAPDFVAHLERFHTYLADTVDWDAVTADAADLVATLRGKHFADLEMTRMFNDIFALGRRHGIRPEPAFALAVVGAITAEGIGKMVDPDLDAIAVMGQFLMSLAQPKAKPHPGP